MKPSKLALTLLALSIVPRAATAVDFAVPVEAAGINPAVKSIRIACVAIAPEGTTIGHGAQFVAVTGGAVSQTVTVTVDIPLNKAKAGVTPYSCAADRAFEVDVTKMKPLPGKYQKPLGHMDEGMDIKQINLQANSVVQVGGKL